MISRSWSSPRSVSSRSRAAVAIASSSAANCSGNRASPPYSATNGSRSSVKNRSSRVMNAGAPASRARTAAYSSRTSGRMA